MRWWICPTRITRYASQDGQHGRAEKKIWGYAPSPPIIQKTAVRVRQRYIQVLDMCKFRCCATPPVDATIIHTDVVTRPQKEENRQFSPFLSHFRYKPGHVPKYINRSVLHLRRPTNISIYTLYICTYYDMTTMGNGLDYFEIWTLEVDFGTPRKPSIFTIFGPFSVQTGTCSEVY